MAAKRRRTTKIHWNIGMIIFVVILVYILINVILFLGKKKLTVYKVTEDKITNTLSFTGIAIRDEELLKASQSGYITYYVEEGKRIKKSGTVFTDPTACTFLCLKTCIPKLLFDCFYNCFHRIFT